MSQLRIGLLGAAKIAKSALMRPAKDVPEVVVAAIAARDRDRAQSYATKHGIERVHSSYDDLIADPSLDAIYNPLPNGLHAEWTLKAIAAGKHVLCEKPFTANATEAREVAVAASRAGVVVTEAFHYRYHPLASKMRSVVDSGELGTIREIRTALCFPLPRFHDIRYSYELGGGAMMDAGCYALNCLRLLGSGEPTVVSAVAKLKFPNVDRAMSADLRFEDGCLGHLDASMWSRKLLKIGVQVKGDRGSLRAFNFVAPQYFNRLSVTVDGRKHSERVAGEPTYTLQLRSFAASVLRGEPNLTPPEDAILNMGLIDDIYVAAGLSRRGA
ncbi:MAG: dehydrogenase [Frankiales bacterium]|nr:dehydrogenase [Frankiales bacterium]